MFKKIMLAISITMIFSLLGSSIALASGRLPTWGTAFDPGSFWADPTYQVTAVEQFKGNLYAAVSDTYTYKDYSTVRVPATQLFRSADGKHWQPASELGFGLGTSENNCWTDETGTPWTAYYNVAWDMTVFQDKLYVGVEDFCYYRPGVIMRSSDGKTWEKAFSADDLGLSWSFDGVNYQYGGVRKLGVFNDMLYVNVDRYNMDYQFLTATILRSPSGNPGSWEKVADLVGNWSGSFHVFKGALYMASDGVIDQDWLPAPDQIWRTFDGKHWEQVVSDGFGNSSSDDLGAFADYKDYLYVGEGAPDDGGGQVWRSFDGKKWEKVITNGLGVPGDDKFDGLVVYHGQLYAYSVNWTQGGTLYRSQNGVNWEPVNEPGWGNPNYATTHLESDQVVFKDQLYLGIYGPQGVLLKMTHP